MKILLNEEQKSYLKSIESKKVRKFMKKLFKDENVVAVRMEKVKNPRKIMEAPKEKVMKLTVKDLDAFLHNIIGMYCNCNPDDKTLGASIRHTFQK